MDFTLSKQHEMAQTLFKEFAENEAKPLAIETDENEAFPKATVEKMGKYGFLGIPVPKELGGQGADILTYVMCVEELSKVCATTGVIVSAHTSLCIDPILTYGTPAQKEKYIPDLASGKKIGAFGLTEPGAGTDAQGQQTKAVLDGDEWVLNGSKCFITNGKEADVYIVIAVTGKVEKRGRVQKEISAFIVEKGDKGFSIGKTEDKMGICASSTTELIMQDLINCLAKIAPTCTNEGMYLHPNQAHIEGAVRDRDEKPEWCLNTDAHVRSIIMGRSVTVPIMDGEIQLGDFGLIYFADWDQVRGRTRTVMVQVMGE